MKRTLFVATAIVAVVGALAVALWAWHGGQGRVSLHGYIALALGTVLALGVGGGLMALMFYSSRRGFDDSQNKPD